MKKTTTLEYLNKLFEKHGNLYDYSKVEYKSSFEKVIGICSIHGEFTMSACNFLKKGCQKCGEQKRKASRALTIQDFIEKAKKVHGDKYDYSKSVYTLASNKIEITCSKHGDFWQTANSHLNKQGCPRCNIGVVWNINDFISVSTLKHNNKYDYSLVEYVNCSTKVEIVCPLHGKFSMTPNNHMRGQGCRKCFNGNFFNRESWIKNSKGKEGIFYILKCWNDNEEFYKVGITTYTKVSLRYSCKSKMPYEWELVKQIKSTDLGYIWDLENFSKIENSKNHYLPLIYFKGHKNECFKEINI